MEQEQKVALQLLTNEFLVGKRLRSRGDVTTNLEQNGSETLSWQIDRDSWIIGKSIRPAAGNRDVLVAEFVGSTNIVDSGDEYALPAVQGWGFDVAYGVEVQHQLFAQFLPAGTTFKLKIKQLNATAQVVYAGFQLLEQIV